MVRPKIQCALVWVRGVHCLVFRSCSSRLEARIATVKGLLDYLGRENNPFSIPMAKENVVSIKKGLRGGYTMDMGKLGCKLASWAGTRMDVSEQGESQIKSPRKDFYSGSRNQTMFQCTFVAVLISQDVTSANRQNGSLGWMTKSLISWQ